jgi:hypothetical protein
VTTDQRSGETGAEVAPVISKELMQRFANMAMAVPSEGEAAYERILLQVLGADTWEQLNEPWESTKAEKLAGKLIKVTGLLRRPSDFKGGLGIFLVVDGTDVNSGERVVVTTGSVSVVGQLVWLYFKGSLPAYVEWVIPERTTESGFRPHHLMIRGIEPKDDAKPSE